MYQRKSRLQNLIILLLDCICITVSLMAANYIRNGRFFSSDDIRMDFGMLLGASLTVFLLMNLFRNLNRDMFLRGPLHELFDIVRNNLVLFAGAAVILYFLNVLEGYSRLVFFFFLIIDCALMFIVHQLWKKYLPALYHYFGETRKILLVADSDYALPLLEDVRNMKDYSYELQGIAIMDKDAAGSDFDGVKVVANADTLVEYCQSASLDEVLVAVRGVQTAKMDNAVEMKDSPEILSVMEILAEMGITVHYHIQVPQLKGAQQKVLSQFGRFYTVTYANRVVPVGQVLLKRMLDVTGALVGCVVLAVLTIIAGPLIKLESPGPIFFAQKRVGRNGRIFKMYKFRSMYADAEERKKELMAKNEMSGFMFKMENDPRITKIGRFMRKTSLDEFPQFINILKGDMSLVGTRPPTLDEFSQYSPYHKKRLSFRPGLTGMWQVSGRSDITDFEEIVRLDVEYIDNWSFGLDIKILLKTVLQVFKGSGAK
ncbi:MAG: sugar transferase [Lachnospiraceae bacterium]|nr:sugar transferase [Lachnospiraceae bacterium]